MIRVSGPFYFRRLSQTVPFYSGRGCGLMRNYKGYLDGYRLGRRGGSVKKSELYSYIYTVITTSRIVVVTTATITTTGGK